MCKEGKLIFMIDMIDIDQSKFWTSRTLSPRLKPQTPNQFYRPC